MSNNEFFLRKLYADIVRGYSVFQLGANRCYLRHLSPLTQGIVDEKYIAYFDEAVKNNIPKEQDKIKELIARKEWSPADEDWIEQQRDFLSNLNTTKSNLSLGSQIKEINNQIKEETARLNERLLRKSILLGTTAESFANSKVNEYYVFVSLFKDPALEAPYFSEEEFDELTQWELQDITRIYNACLEGCNSHNIKKICISQFFQNVFYLSENLHDFFGLPIAHLTYYQIELGSFGRYFKRIFSSEKQIPSEIRDNPDKIIDWYNGSNNLDARLQNTKGQNVGVVGASYEDLGDESKQFISKLRTAAKDKKTLSIGELMKL